MGWIEDKAGEADQRYQELIRPLLQPDEPLLGVLQATQAKTFSSKLFVIGVTPERIVMVVVDRKIQAKEPPVTIRRGDIVKSSVDGFGGGMAHFLTTDLGEIRFDTAQESYKLMIIGGGMDQMLTGEGQLNGKGRFLEFIASARGIH